ncbi:MmgE/PrpD family protein [Variovorax sp. PBL-H6]|uniref:MmgE/PrpD family protein n=1 Tax=Variovorax sp. PBL-H6 TaxID=434009 RepID=UPI001318FEBA|nr:MmgE/PrpD family protein [Variovorax sp. PBL-H6]VTU33528.1 MmgE/PrpD family protein [Variovorax sp. PBL-H6]
MLHDSPTRTTPDAAASGLPSRSSTLLGRLADFVAGISLDRLPEAVMEKAKCHVLYTMCNAVATGTVADPVAPCVAAIGTAFGPCMAWGTTMTGGAGEIAFLNAVSGSYRAQNDFDPLSATHPGLVVIPATLSLAQARKSGGASVLEAVIAGYEVCTRLAAPMAQSLAARGMRPTAVVGAMAAGAAAARLLGLDVAQTANAIGLASQVASGTLQCWTEGTPEWRLQFGTAADAGIRAALLAEQGVVAAQSGLDGSQGLYCSMTGKVPEMGFEGWSILDVELQAFPGSAAVQPVLQALALVLEERNSSQGTGAVEITFSEEPGFRGPAMEERGLFQAPDQALASARFMSAVLGVHGTEGLSDWRRYVNSARVANVAARILIRSGQGGGDEISIRMDGAAPVVVPRKVFAGHTWRQTVALLAPSARAWSFPKSLERFVALAGGIERLERLDNVDCLLETIRPAETTTTKDMR